MDVKSFVDNELCVPVTRIGNKYVVEAIELVLDTHNHKFYNRLAEITQTSPRYLEKAMRDAIQLGLRYMNIPLRESIFGTRSPSTTEYVIIVAEYYRRTYADKKA